MHRCGLCNRPLQDRESIELGFGPTCWQRLSGAAGAEGHHPAYGVSTASPSVASGSVASASVASASAVADGGVSDAPGPVPVRPSRLVLVPREASRPQPDPAATRRPAATAPPALAAVGWLLVLGALVALVEYWRWVVIGLAVLGGVAALGVLLEWTLARRDGQGARASPPRSYRL